MEASSQIRHASQNQPLEAVKARVTTRAFGIRIGSFGVDYTSKKVEVDPDGQAGRGRQNGTAAEYAGYSPSGLRTGTAGQSSQEPAGQDAATATSSQGAPSTPDSAAEAYSGAATSGHDAASHPDPLWRKGLTAYAKAKDLLLSDTSRTGRISLAVA